MKDGIPDSDALRRLEREAREAVEAAGDVEALERARVAFLGRKQGRLTAALRSIGALPPDQRPVIGNLINEVKGRLDTLFDGKHAELTGSGADPEPFPGDATLPGRRGWEGGRHILHRVLRDAKEIFVRMGYSIAHGPDVELDYYNFEALNFPPDHPSRDTQDTFYVNMDILLRTQT
ncbi:MAG: phenylalanine--tRNA ligase subunit alpha, partial [Candidatus Krumholzibacteria bacterium]|nr:phenylalanine--tRNA ligase subunit alpha [Candidatus Krumholzibacteria bacterium]